MKYAASTRYQGIMADEMPSLVIGEDRFSRTFIVSWGRHVCGWQSRTRCRCLTIRFMKICSPIRLNASSRILGFSELSLDREKRKRPLGSPGLMRCRRDEREPALPAATGKHPFLQKMVRSGAWEGHIDGDQRRDQIPFPITVSNHANYLDMHDHFLCSNNMRSYAIPKIRLQAVRKRLRPFLHGR